MHGVSRRHVLLLHLYGLLCNASREAQSANLTRQPKILCLLQSKTATTFRRLDPLTVAQETLVTKQIFESSERSSNLACFIGGILVGALLSALVTARVFGAKPADAESQCADSAVPPAVLHAASAPALPAERASSPSSTEELASMDYFWPRCSILGLLMVFQSSVSAILLGFESLLQAHPEFLVFLTMVVGTGGNVGGQSVVNAVRKMALGKEVTVLSEVHVALKLAAVLGPLGFIRTFAQVGKLPVSIAIAVSVAAVIVLAAFLGVGMPKVLKWMKVDPAHATPIIQVSMDIVGALVVCLVGQLLLRGIFMSCPGGDSWAIFTCD